MLSDFFAKRKMADLIQGARDPRRSDRSACIAELGTLPPTDEAVACLIELSRNHLKEYSTSKEAVAALGKLDHPRSSEHLLELLRRDEGRVDDTVGKAYGNPRHARALPDLARLALQQCRSQAYVYGVGDLIDLMIRIDPVAGQAHLEELAPAVLDCALRELRTERISFGARFSGERILARCRQQAGRDALRSFQEAVARRLTGVLSTASDLDEIRHALEWLKQSPLPAAQEAVAVFFRTPARQVTKLVQEVISDDDDPAVKTVTRQVSCSTMELGQPRDREELAKRDADSDPRARQAYETMKSKREHRERIYPELLRLGRQEDLEEYAKACLDEPVYDVFHSATSSGGRATLNALAGFLQKAPGDAKAAELLRLILHADRTKLWECTHQAWTWRPTPGSWPSEINWKPLALDLLDRTGDPTLDKFLFTELEAGQELPGDLLWAMFARRTPGRLLELSERLLGTITPTKIPANSPAWKNATALELLRETLSAKGNRARALDVILAERPLALHMARDLKGRGKIRDRLAAYLILCVLEGPEIQSDLTRWLSEEPDTSVAPLLARFLNPSPVPPPAPVPTATPDFKDVPIILDPAPLAEPPLVVPPPPPKLRPQSPAELWARVRARLQQLRAIPDGSPTPEEIARHADKLLGHAEVSNFVQNFYYPALYGKAPNETQIEAVHAWLDQFEGNH